MERSASWEAARGFARYCKAYVEHRADSEARPRPAKQGKEPFLEIGRLISGSLPDDQGGFTCMHDGN